MEELIFEKSSPGRKGIVWPAPDVPTSPAADLLGEENLRDELPLPEVSQLDVMRHYTHLSSMNFGLENG
ncbi:MAG: aminomethyl-transferring glycine dehydrogenase subunit GcvPB, partial [Armatimonadota bacterium]